MRLISTVSTLVFFVLVMAMLIGCASSEGEAPDTTNAATTHAAHDTTAHNALTADERAEGWKLLFDGTAEGLKAHWRGYQVETVPSGWQAEDGTLTFVPGGEGGSIITRDTYGDFVLKLDWKISEGGNSGILFRITEEYDKIWKSGPEMQVLDNEGHTDSSDSTHRAGANYDLHAPAEEAVKPAGEWNQARIEVRDGHVEYWLNGTKTVEYQIGSDEWNQLVAESKFGEFAFAEAEEGHIALQDHGDRVWYRNVKILPLD